MERKIKTQNRKLKLNLLENAIDSLKIGLQSYEDGLHDEEIRFKYAAINFSLYIELSLKYFVYKIHPILIFSNCFSGKINTNKTITMFEALNFLKNIDKFDCLKNKTHIKNLEWLNKEANSIKHYEIDMDLSDFKKISGKILQILDDMYNAHDISIKDHLTDSQQDELYETIINDYKRDLMLASNDSEKKAELFLQISKDDIPEVTQEDAWVNCPSCGENTFVLNQNYSEYECSYCGHKEKAVVCNQCNKTFPASEAQERIDTITPVPESGEEILTDSTYWCSDSCSSKSKAGWGCE